MSIQLLDGGGSHNVDRKVRILMKNNISPHTWLSPVKLRHENRDMRHENRDMRTEN